MNVLIRRSMARRARQYLLMPGTAGNYPSTPSSTAINAVLTDFTITLWLERFTAAGGAVQSLLTKRGAAGTAGVTQWQSRFDATGEPRLVVGDGAVTTFGGVATAALPTTANWLKITFDADNGAAGSTTRFYHANSRGRPGAWTQLGNDVTVAAVMAGIGVNAQPVTFGALSDDGAANRFSGQLRLAEFASGIDGPAVIRLDPSRFISGNSLQSDTGEVWTINRSGGNPARVAA